MIGLDRLKRAISDVPTGGMQTGSPKVKLDLSFAHRVVAEMEQLEREKAELVAQGLVMKDALDKIANWTECTAEFRINYGSNGERDFYRNAAAAALKSTPTQCLNQIKAEAGRAGFVAGYHSCWFQHYGTRPPEHATAYSADQYAASIAKGE